MGIRNFFRNLFASSSLTSELYTASKCGHRTRQSGTVFAFERRVTTTMPLDENGVSEYCLDCIGKMAIQCAWCKSPIFIGNPVTLYSPKKGFETPEHAVVYSEDPLRLVGCLGWNCADTGADRAGFWLPDEGGRGHVVRVQSPIEKIMSGKPSVVAVRDIGDIHEAIK